MFPFKWMGKVYRECTTSHNNGSLWCATDVDPLHNYVDDMWGNCADTCPGCRTVEGGTCKLPFVTEEGVTHEECAMDGGSDILWCLSEMETAVGNTSVVRATCQPGCASRFYHHYISDFKVNILQSAVTPTAGQGACSPSFTTGRSTPSARWRRGWRTWSGAPLWWTRGESWWTGPGSTVTQGAEKT